MLLQWSITYRVTLFCLSLCFQSVVNNVAGQIRVRTVGHAVVVVCEIFIIWWQFCFCLDLWQISGYGKRRLGMIGKRLWKLTCLKMNRLNNNCHSPLIRATVRLLRDGFSAIKFWEVDFSLTSEKQKKRFETFCFLSVVYYPNLTSNHLNI